MKIIKYLKNPYKLFPIFASKGFFDKMDDKKYIKRMYRSKMGKKLDLKNPKTFNEKLQWLKLYNRKPEYTMMVDKYLVREYIKEKLGEEYLIPLIGVWDSPEEIDFDALPEKFVLKCNHNSGCGMYICKDKSKMDVEAVKAELRKGLAQDYYLTQREWPYKNVPRKIIAEQFMTQYDDSGKTVPGGLTDYKFYCFNGEPRFLYISKDLDRHECAAISFLTLDWQFAPYGRSDYPPFKELPAKPKHYEQMLQVARELSCGIDFLRVDLYEINGRIYFSELTFSPCAGMMPFVDNAHDREIGDMLQLSKKAEMV